MIAIASVRYLLFVAWSQLRNRPWQSALLVISVSVGVMILTTALSLTNGFEQDMVDRLLGTTPHVALYNPLSNGLRDYEIIIGKLGGRQHITSALPFIQGQALMTNDSHKTVGVLVRGVDPARSQRTPAWSGYVVGGKLEDTGLGPGVMLGTEVARTLGVGIGDHVDLVTGLGKRRGATVTGLFESGLYEFDAHVAFITLPTAQAVFGLNQAVTGIDVGLDDVFLAPRFARELSTEFFLGARAWSDQNRPLLKAMFFERVVIFIVIMFIVLVALIGVGSTMAMWVTEKHREISILRAIGISGSDIGQMFVLQGTMISVAGVVLGTVGGILLSLLLTVIPIKMAAEVYLISHLPVRMEARDFILVALVTLVISPVASVMPALRAMRLDPIEVIRRT